jgi:hypothetical protein
MPYTERAPNQPIAVIITVSKCRLMYEHPSCPKLRRYADTIPISPIVFIKTLHRVSFYTDFDKLPTEIGAL